MSHADKALAAILEYDRLMSAINDCRKILSNPANECDRAVTVEEWTYIPDNKHSRGVSWVHRFGRLRPGASPLSP